MNQEKEFVGNYFNSDLGKSIELLDNGTWEYKVTEDINYLELYGKCDNGYYHLQIYEPNNIIDFSADQNTTKLKPRVQFKKTN